MNRVEMILAVVKAARAVKDDWAERSFSNRPDVRHSPPLMNNLANAIYVMDQHIPEHPPSTTSAREDVLMNIPPGDPSASSEG
jgi:hypothetical protein